MSRHDYLPHEGSLEPEPRPSSNNSGLLYTDFTEDNTRDNTRDNSEEASMSSDEDRILDGEEMTKEEQIRARKAKLRLMRKATPNAAPVDRVKKVRKVREEKAITLEGLGGGGGSDGGFPSGPSSSSHPAAAPYGHRPHRLPAPPSHLRRFPLPPSRLAEAPKKKKAEEDLEEGELSDEEEDDRQGREGQFGHHAAPFIPREAYYARRRMRKSPESGEESGSESSGSRSRSGSRSPTPPPREGRYPRRGRSSSAEEGQSPYENGYY